MPLQSTGAQSKESEEQGQLQQQSLHEKEEVQCYVRLSGWLD